MKKIVYIVFVISLLVVSCKKQVTCSNNEIVYTTKYGYPIEFEVSEGFGGHMVSNIYEGGYGRITFDNDVVNIPLRAFEGCETLTSIILPECLTGIERYAFSGCINLAEFKGKFAADGGRCLIRDNTIIAYAEASGTEYVIPDSVTTIGDCAFYECTSITSITIPESITTIGEGAFFHCNNLISINIPNDITTIGEGAFARCKSLTNVTIPNSVTTIGEYAFAYCESLTSITIPDSVTAIGEWTFYNCESLTNVMIGNGANMIGDYAFCECNNLKNVYCKSVAPPKVGKSIFFCNASDRKIYVSTESVDEYKTSSYWNNYTDSILGYDFAE